MQGENYWTNRYSWIKEIKVEANNKRKYNTVLRELLNISLDDQLNWNNDSNAYHNWRSAVEDRLGILVFQFPMPIKEIQGFCSIERIPYAIVTNSNHSYTARTFTIFHELAHILRQQSGMCLFEKATEKQNEEWDCNTFAGSFLVPTQVIEKTDELSKIAMYSSKLKVSREVYLRRLKEENKINDSRYFDLLTQIKETYKIPKRKLVLLNLK